MRQNRGIAMSELQISIRKMHTEDIPFVEEIESAVFSRPWSARAFLSAMQQDTLFVTALADERIVGYCGMYCSFEEGEITNVAVDPAHQNCGIGKALMQYLLNQARQKGITRVILEVRISNENAMRLYRSLGFQNCGIRKNFYELPREDGMVMAWEADRR